jgi:hypothetical protein
LPRAGQRVGSAPSLSTRPWSILMRCGKTHRFYVGILRWYDKTASWATNRRMYPFCPLASVVPSVAPVWYMRRKCPRFLLQSSLWHRLFFALVSTSRACVPTPSILFSQFHPWHQMDRWIVCHQSSSPAFHGRTDGWTDVRVSCPRCGPPAGTRRGPTAVATAPGGTIRGCRVRRDRPDDEKGYRSGRPRQQGKANQRKCRWNIIQ